MKSTDTILGAFGVMGILLLGIVVVSSLNSNSQSSETLVTNTDSDSEIVLNEVSDDLDVAESSDVIVDSHSNSNPGEIILNKPDFNFDITRWQDYGITNQELLALVDSADNNLALNQVDQSVLQELESLLNTNLQESKLNFKQQNSDEVVLGSTNSDDEIVLESPGGSDQQVVSDVTTTKTDNDAELFDDSTNEVVKAESEKSSSRISAFFDNLFGDNDSDVGGNAEEVNNSEVLVDNGDTYVVDQGDNLWDILTVEYNFTNAQAASAINGIASNPGSIGISSGSVDLIYPGQVLSIGALVG